MRKYFICGVIILVAIGALAESTNTVLFDIRNFVGGTISNRQVFITMTNSPAVGSNIFIGDRQGYRTGTNTPFTFTVTNMFNPASYKVEIQGPFSLTTFSILVPDVGSNHNAKDLLTTTNGPPSASAGYSQSQADARFLRQLAIGNSLLVSTNATNSSAERLRWDKPSASPTNAVRLAQIGDVGVIFPGTYDNTNRTTLSSNGVNWFLLPGVTIRHIGNNSLPPFTDNTNLVGFGGSYAVTNIVRGAGSLVFSNFVVADNTANDSAIYVSHPDSRFDIEVDRITPFHQSSAFWQSNGWAALTANEVNSTNYPPFWFAGGEAHLDIKNIGFSFSDASGAIYLRSDVANTNADNWFVRANMIQASNNSTAYYAANGSGGKNFRTWMNVPILNARNGVTIHSDVGYGYFDSQKIGNTFATYGTTVGMIEFASPSRNWLRTMKAEPSGQFGTLITGGTNWLDILDMEDNGNTHSLFGESGGETWVRLLNGRGSGATNTAGIFHVGGTAFYQGGLIDLSKAPGTNSWGVNLSGPGLMLQNMNFSNNATTYSVYSGAARMLDIRGTLTANRPLSPSVIITNGAFINTASNTAMLPFIQYWQRSNDAAATRSNLFALGTNNLSAATGIAIHRNGLDLTISNTLEAGGSQTPWTNSIDGANYSLSAVATLTASVVIAGPGSFTATGGNGDAGSGADGEPGAPHSITAGNGGAGDTGFVGGVGANLVFQSGFGGLGGGGSAAGTNGAVMINQSGGKLIVGGGGTNSVIRFRAPFTNQEPITSLIQVRAPVGTKAIPSFAVATVTNTGFYFGGDAFGFAGSAAAQMWMNGTEFRVVNGCSFGVSSSATDPENQASDVLWKRDSAGTWASRVGTAAQTNRIYGRFVSLNANAEWVETGYDNDQTTNANQHGAFFIRSRAGTSGTNQPLFIGVSTVPGAFFNTNNTFVITNSIASTNQTPFSWNTAAGPATNAITANVRQRSLIIATVGLSAPGAASLYVSNVTTGWVKSSGVTNLSVISGGAGVLVGAVDPAGHYYWQQDTATATMFEFRVIGQ